MAEVIGFPFHNSFALCESLLAYSSKRLSLAGLEGAAMFRDLLEGLCVTRWVDSRSRKWSSADSQQGRGDLSSTVARN